jgi:hypothetical protein
LVTELFDLKKPFRPRRDACRGRGTSLWSIFDGIKRNDRSVCFDRAQRARLFEVVDDLLVSSKARLDFTGVWGGWKRSLSIARSLAAAVEGPRAGLKRMPGDKVMVRSRNNVRTTERFFDLGEQLHQIASVATTSLR